MKDNRLNFWFENARFAATMQSLIPALMAAVLAIGNPGFCWYTAVLAVIGVNLAHCGMNLLDDYFDYLDEVLEARMKVVRRGFKAFTAKYPYLTEGKTSLKGLKCAIAVFGGVALLLGAVCFLHWTKSNGFAFSDGSAWIVAMTAAAVILGYFYDAAPLRLSYHGLGELTVGIIFGPLLMTGVYYAACGTVDGTILLMSIPVGLMVMNILFTHSIIDNAGDEESDKHTLASVIGSKKGNILLSAVINFAPFAVVIAAVAAGEMHPAYLLTLLMLPRAVWLVWSLWKFTSGEEIDTDHPKWYLGRFDYWEQAGQANLRWYLIRWFTARNIVTGFSFLAIIVKIALLIIL